MKICFATPSIPISVYKLILKMSQSNEVFLIYLSSSLLNNLENKMHSCCNSYEIEYPKHVYSLAESKNKDYIRTIPTYIKLFIKIKNIAKKHNIDIVHAQWAIPCGFFAIITHTSTPVIVTVRGSDIKVFTKKFLFRQIIKFTLKKATRVIALSNDLKQEVVNLGVNQNKIVVIPGGVDTNQFKPIEKKFAEAKLMLCSVFRIVYVGNLIKLKNVDSIINCCAALSIKYRLQLIIIGDGPEKENLKKLCNKLSFKEVLFVGKISNNDIPLYMGASDVLVLASTSEGLPECVQEAMACGLPIIARNVGGLADLVKEGLNGFLFNNDDELSQKLELLLSSEQLRINMGIQSFQIANKDFSIEIVAERTMQLYKEVLSGNK